MVNLKSVFVLVCSLGLAVGTATFRFGTRYGNSGVLNYVPSSLVSATPAPYTITRLSGNNVHPYRNPVATFVSTTPSSRPQLVQLAPAGSFFSPTRYPTQPPRINDAVFSGLPAEQGFISSTASPPIFGVSGSGFGSTVAPPINVIPADSVNFGPIPVEVSNTGSGGITTVDTSVFEPPNEAPLVSKHVYLFSAPDEPEDVVHKHFTIGKPQKAYRVVFIKAPSSSGQAKISASFAPKEEKTVIYVLSKKPNQVEIKDIVTPPPTEPSKPEVIFVKYKTNEEAIHAQQTIQAQYDQLGGASQVSDEGIAPITSVIGVLGQSENNGQNEILSDQLVAVTPTPGTSNGIFPLNKQYKVLTALGTE